MLGDFQLSILRVLATCDATSGFDVRWLSHYVEHPYCKLMPRARSGAISSKLRELESAGLVRKLDDQKPIVWAISEDGRKAIST